VRITDFLDITLKFTESSPLRHLSPRWLFGHKGWPGTIVFHLSNFDPYKWFFFYRGALTSISQAEGRLEHQIQDVKIGLGRSVKRSVIKSENHRNFFYTTLKMEVPCHCRRCPYCLKIYVQSKGLNLPAFTDNGDVIVWLFKVLQMIFQSNNQLKIFTHLAFRTLSFYVFFSLPSLHLCLVQRKLINTPCELQNNFIVTFSTTMQRNLRSSIYTLAYKNKKSHSTRTVSHDQYKIILPGMNVNLLFMQQDQSQRYY
jgi:hypothetical protein